MYPATESGRSKSGPFVTDDFCTVFIRRTPVENKTASECIRAAAATYACKNFTTIRIRCERVRTRCELRMTPPGIPVHTA